MSKRKFGLVLGLLISMMMIFSPKNVYAGTCICKPNGETEVWNVGTNNCESDEYASGCSGSLDSPARCECVKKGTTSETVSGSSYNPFDGCSSTSINTALGCIPVEMERFVPWLMTWLFGVAGGIAFLLMAYGFILIATSAGDEKKIQGAKETITSAVTGLIICIFAIFILRLIAVNILKIPGIS